MSDLDLRSLYENVRRGEEYVAPKRETDLYVEVLGNVVNPYDNPTQQPQTSEPTHDTKPTNVRRDAAGKFMRKDLLCPDDAEDCDIMDASFKEIMGRKDPREMNELFKVMKNLQTYPLIHKALVSKRWSGMAVGRYAQELESRIKEHAIRSSDSVKQLQSYLEKVDKQLKFGQKTSGNLISELSNSGPKLDKALVADLFQHKTQDEKTRGIGMGELAMTVFYSNVGSAEGAGDLGVGSEGYYYTTGDSSALAIEGEAGELEVKGHGAVLGDAPEARKLNKDAVSNALGIVESGNGIIVSGSDQMFAKNEFSLALSTKFSELKGKERNNFKDNLWAILSDPNQGDITGVKNAKTGATHAEDIKQMFYNINFKDPENIQWSIGLMNFVRYAGKEGFEHFMVHDFGSLGKLRSDNTPGAGAPGNTGKYVYVTGDPVSMANDLKKLKSTGLDFEAISMANVRPRIGLPTMGKNIKDPRERMRLSRKREPSPYRKTSR